jgi:hypothetical protein
MQGALNSVISQIFHSTQFILMASFTKHLLLALTGTALLSSCSRQYAVMQRTPSVSYHSPAAPITAPAIAEPIASQPIESASVTTSQDNVSPVPVAEPVVAIQTVRKQLDEAVAVNSRAVTGNGAVEKRVSRVQQLLATAEQQATMTPTTAAAPTKKMNLTERLMLKKLNARINKQMAPDKVNALDRTTRIGLIVAIIGLLLLILGSGSVLSTVGIIALVVGLVLVLVGLIN